MNSSRRIIYGTGIWGGIDTIVEIAKNSSDWFVFQNLVTSCKYVYFQIYKTDKITPNQTLNLDIRTQVKKNCNQRIRCLIKEALEQSKPVNICYAGGTSPNTWRIVYLRSISQNSTANRQDKFTALCQNTLIVKEYFYHKVMSVELIENNFN